MLIDRTDKQILDLLKENSRYQLKEIGEKVHMTGQAVANRIKRMEDLGIIKSYTVEWDYEKIGLPVLAIITVFLQTANHAAFQQFIEQDQSILEAHRISGEGCYILKINVASHQELSRFLDRILQYGNYKVSMSIQQLK